MNTLEISIVIIAGFLSGVIKNGVGVGGGIFLLPTLSLAFPAKIALGLGAPLMLASDAIGMRYYWKQWATKQELARLLLSALPGLLLGTILLPIIPAGGFRLGVGLFGMTYALLQLWPALLTMPPLNSVKNLLSGFNERHTSKQIYFYGALGGVATVMAHAGGLVWSLYLMTTMRDRRVFVGTIVLLFFLTNIYKTAAYLYIGALSVQSLIDVLPAVPAVWLGSSLGNYANKRVQHELFRKIVLAVIFIVSLQLCF